MRNKNDQSDSETSNNSASDCDNYNYIFNSPIINKPSATAPTNIPSDTDACLQSPLESPIKPRKSNKIQRASSVASPRKFQSSMSPKSPKSPQSKKLNIKSNRQVKIFRVL